MFRPTLANFGLGSGSKTFLGPTYADYSFCFRKYSPIFFFLFRPHSGSFLTFFWHLGANFAFGVTFKNIFGTY